MPQANGLSMLGSVILNASERAATQRQKTADLADARARQDTLLRDERAYQKEQTGLDRTARLEDDLKLTRQRTQEAILSVLERENLLKPGERNDPAKVQRALEMSSTRGKLKEYEPLILGGFLKAEQVADDAAVQAAMNASGGVATSERTRKDTQFTQSTAQATDVARKLREAEEEERTILTRLRQLETGATTQPTPAEVRRAAIQVVMSRVPGRSELSIPEKEIAAEMPKVVQALQNRALDAAIRQQEVLERQLDQVRSIRTALVSQQNVLSNRGAFAGPESAAPAMVAPPTAQVPAARPAGSPMGGFLQQLEAEAAAMPPPPPPPIQQGQPGWTPPSAPPGLPNGFTPPMRQPGRPITPSANIFPTSPPRWWSAA